VIHNEKAVISVYQQEATFQGAGKPGLHTPVAYIQAGLGSESPQVLHAISVSVESQPSLPDAPLPTEGGHGHWSFPA